MEPWGYHEKSSKTGFKIRKRRLLISFVALLGLVLLAFRTRIFKFNQNDRAWTAVTEMYGFLHVVLNEDSSSEGLRSSELKLDLEGVNRVPVYDPGFPVEQWSEERMRIDEEYPVIVFSKSYCPYSTRAKQLLKSLQLEPEPKIIEVDLRNDGQEIKQLLMRLTHHSTFPNILVKGHSLGGSDDLAKLHSLDKLRPILLKAGVKA